MYFQEIFNYFSTFFEKEFSRNFHFWYWLFHFSGVYYMYDNPDYGRPKGAGQNGLIVRDAWIFQNPNNSGCLNIDIFVVKIICSSASSSKSYVDVCRYSSVSLIVGVVIIIVVHRLVGTSSWLIVGIVIGITDCSFIHRQIFIGIGVGMSIQMQSSASVNHRRNVA